MRRGRVCYSWSVCGICGVVSLDGDLPPNIAGAVGPMTQRLHHRGPDGGAVYHTPWFAFGHRRLAIIDRAGGEQPLANEDQSVWIVFNGEIYNHLELRRDLQGRGHRFRTRSDTEAIVHAYEEYGDACVERLDGMFAFAIGDENTRRVLLGRDRLGKKPLFHATLDGVLHFASEIKAIKASPVWNGAQDLEAIEGYLSLGYFVAPHTAYRHVHKLEPGHVLAVDGCRVSSRKYWDIQHFDTNTRSRSELLDEVDARLSAAVSQRLESEVPIGAFLSGGIDSGLVVSYMAESLGQPPVTATVGFDHFAHNELDAAALTAARYHTRHHTAVVEPCLDDVLDPIVAAFDEPFADSSSIPTYYVSKMAREHVTVALSGDGADEAFGGYGWRFLGRDPAAAYYADLCFLKPHDARALLGKSPRRDPSESPVFEQVTRPYRECPSESAVQRAEYADLKIYLPNGPSVKVDRMSTEDLVHRPKSGFTAPVGAWLAGSYAGRFREDVLSADSKTRDIVDRERQEQVAG
jgi:asparagine synthase (glutamine-hydrolysing)